MKTTVLIYKEVDGVRQLVVATKKEWEDILEANRGLPMAERRLFEENTIKEGNEVDRMFIEVSLEDYQKWHREASLRAKRHKNDSEYEVFSLDAPVPDEEESESHEIVPSPLCLEDVAVDNILLSELKNALAAWNPWALEMLDCYLSTNARTCTEELCKKHNLSDRAVQKRKKAFENFVQNFLQ